MCTIHLDQNISFVHWQTSHVIKNKNLCVVSSFSCLCDAFMPKHEVRMMAWAKPIITAFTELPVRLCLPLLHRLLHYLFIEKPVEYIANCSLRRLHVPGWVVVIELATADSGKQYHCFMLPCTFTNPIRCFILPYAFIHQEWCRTRHATKCLGTRHSSTLARTSSTWQEEKRQTVVSANKVESETAAELELDVGNLWGQIFKKWLRFLSHEICKSSGSHEREDVGVWCSWLGKSEWTKKGHTYVPGYVIDVKAL